MWFGVVVMWCGVASCGVVVRGVTKCGERGAMRCGVVRCGVLVLETHGWGKVGPTTSRQILNSRGRVVAQLPDNYPTTTRQIPSKFVNVSAILVILGVGFLGACSFLKKEYYLFYSFSYSTTTQEPDLQND